MTSLKRFQERYPHMWEAAQGPLAEVDQPVVFVEARRTRTAAGVSVWAKWMPDRPLEHKEPYEWVSVHGTFDVDGRPLGVEAWVVRGDEHYDHTLDT